MAKAKKPAAPRAKGAKRKPKPKAKPKPIPNEVTPRGGRIPTAPEMIDDQLKQIVPGKE